VKLSTQETRKFAITVNTYHQAHQHQEHIRAKPQTHHLLHGTFDTIQYDIVT
jgi:hypothetical protein